MSSGLKLTSDADHMQGWGSMTLSLHLLFSCKVRVPLPGSRSSTSQPQLPTRTTWVSLPGRLVGAGWAAMEMPSNAPRGSLHGERRRVCLLWGCAPRTVIHGSAAVALTKNFLVCHNSLSCPTQAAEPEPAF